MKQREIKQGKSYTNGKGNVRDVTKIEHTLANHRHCDPYLVTYRQGRKRSGPNVEGKKYLCTLSSFARWAKAMVAIVLCCVTSCATTRTTTPAPKAKRDKAIVCYQEGTQDPPPWYNHPAFVAGVSLLSGVAIVGGAWIMKSELER